jgi:hypothetical protein
MEFTGGSITLCYTGVSGGLDILKQVELRSGEQALLQTRIVPCQKEVSAILSRFTFSFFFFNPFVLT